MREGRNLVGVDIGSSAIKVCQVKETRKGPVLQRLGFAPLPPNTIADGQVVEPRGVVETLKRVFSDSKIRRKDVALSVSGQAVIIRKISVPTMSPQELSEQISWEAEQHIPFDIKDVQVDYQVLRRREEESQMDLLLVAAKKEQIQEYAQLARDAKLRPLVVDIDAFAIQNLFEASFGLSETETVALINVGASLSSLNVLTGNVSAFTREIASGGNVITEEVQRQLGVSPEQAEAFKFGIPMEGQALPPNLPGVIEQVLDSIAAEIQRSLDFFMATSGDGEIGRIVLTGGTANLANLAGAIQRRSRVKVEMWNPVHHFTVDGGVNRAILDQVAAQLAVSLGLTLRKEREVRA